MLSRRRAFPILDQLTRATRRAVSTLPNSPHIYVHSTPSSDGSTPNYTLSLLPTSPPSRSLAVGTTPTIPPTPTSLTANPSFLAVLRSVVSEHATGDPQVQSQAQAYASSGGATLGSGGAFFPQQHQRRRGEARRQGGGGGAGGDGAGGASKQGGPGGAGRGGWVHVSDNRHPPDFGRIADPEDIFGSVEVDGEGQFVGEKGNYQDSGTYRVCTNDGILGLSPYLMERLVERLREQEKSNT